MRDVSYDEDRCRVHTGHLPRNLACLTNVAISIVRLKGRFDYLPQAHRHYARCPEAGRAPPPRTGYALITPRVFARRYPRWLRCVRTATSASRFKPNASPTARDTTRNGSCSPTRAFALQTIAPAAHDANKASNTKMAVGR